MAPFFSLYSKALAGAAVTSRVLWDAVSSLQVVYGAVLTVSIGAGASGSVAGYRGGNGAAGYARLTWDEKAASFTASGSVVVD